MAKQLKPLLVFSLLAHVLKSKGERDGNAEWQLDWISGLALLKHITKSGSILPERSGSRSEVRAILQDETDYWMRAG